MFPRTIERGSRVLGVAVVAMSVAMAAFAALVLPYHHADALVFSRWSRLVGLTGDFHFSVLQPIDLQRPLFYVTQGWLWRIFGFHETLGRLLALAFGIALLAAVASLGRLVGGRDGALLAALFLVLTPDFLRGFVQGLTDVPVAAGVAVAARLLFVREPSRLVSAGLVVAAGAAVLTKPTAALALAGFAVAAVILRSASLRTLGPLALGVGLALVYDVAEAHRAHVSLYAFLTAGTSGEWAALAGRVRTETLAQTEWLGTPLRLPLWFAALYALFRLLGARHSLAARIALPAAIAGAWSVPALQASRPLGPLGDPSAVNVAAFVVFALLLATTVVTPDDAASSRRELAALVVAGLPVVLVWADHAVYATRLLSPAWPALALLLAASFRPVLSGAARLGPAAVAAPIATVAAFAALGLGSVDGLGTDGWHYLLASRPSGWVDAVRMRRLVLGDYVDEAAQAGQAAGATGRILSTDARLGFSFPRRLTFAYPGSCAALRGYRSFVLLRDSDSAAKMEARRTGGSTVAAWQDCASPSTRLLPRVSDRFAVFAVSRVP